MKQLFFSLVLLLTMGVSAQEKVYHYPYAQRMYEFKMMVAKFGNPDPDSAREYSFYLGGVPFDIVWKFGGYIRQHSKQYKVGKVYKTKITKSDTVQIGAREIFQAYWIKKDSVFFLVSGTFKVLSYRKTKITANGINSYVFFLKAPDGKRQTASWRSDTNQLLIRPYNRGNEWDSIIYLSAFARVY